MTDLYRSCYLPNPWPFGPLFQLSIRQAINASTIKCHCCFRVAGNCLLHGLMVLHGRRPSNGNPWNPLKRLGLHCSVIGVLILQPLYIFILYTCHTCIHMYHHGEHLMDSIILQIQRCWLVTSYLQMIFDFSVSGRPSTNGHA